MILPDFTFEKKLWEKGYDVLGIDEVGRGAFAGPLVLSGVIFPKYADFTIHPTLRYINDSKMLLPQKRKNIADEILKHASFTLTVTIPVTVVNRYGIGKSTYIGVRKICKEARKSINCHLFMDGFRIPYVKGFGKTRQQAIVQGDKKSVSIAAASIIAKVYRDALMENLHQEFEKYNFKKNKGYGTKFHRLMIQQYGLTKAHRTSFSLEKFCNC